VQLVTPTTPDDRLSTLVGASSGFVYAVTMTGVTGGQVDLAPAQVEYLERVTARASLPVLAGFGVRDRSNVEALSAHVDGVVVGSALIDAIDRGEDPGEFLATLRPVTAGS
jgi:tryptophan synthase alpha chain